MCSEESKDFGYMSFNQSKSDKNDAVLPKIRAIRELQSAERILRRLRQGWVAVAAVEDPRRRAPRLHHSPLAGGDASKAFPFQFGSIIPSYMNGMAIPARTSSAPPNLDEQKRDQVRHDSYKSAASSVPIPPVPKQQQPPRKMQVSLSNLMLGDYTGTKAKKDPQVTALTPANQMQKPSVLPVTGISMATPYHQSHASLQFGGPNPQMQSQGLQPHPMHPQGIIHQGQNVGFTPQMGHQLSHQLGNMGIGISPQYPQQQGGKFAGPRKTTPVKITHPDTHEELRLDRADAYSDGGSSGARSHPNIPSQSQPVKSFGASHPMSYYPSSSYNTTSLYYPPSSSLPLTSSQITPNSQPPLFNYPVNRGPQNHLVTLAPLCHKKGLKLLWLKQSAAPVVVTAEKLADTSLVLPSAAVSEDSASVVANNEDRRRESLSRSNSLKDNQKKKLGKKGYGAQAADSLNHHKHDKIDESSEDLHSTDLPETTSKDINDSSENAGSDSMSLSVSNTKDRPILEPNKGPEEKKEAVLISESTESASTSGSSMQLPADASQSDAIAGEKCGHSKAEPDDWEEDADMSTPKLEVDDKSQQVNDGSGGQVGCLEWNVVAVLWLMKTDGIKFLVLFILDEVWMVLGVMWDFELAKEAILVFKESSCTDTCAICWGILSGPMQSVGNQGGMQRNSPDGERWQRAASFQQRGLIPSPTPQTPMQMMHKAEKKYEVGKVTDVEEAKQRQLKGILNKLTPQNFDRLFEQVKAVNIDSAVTLTGVISQIFEKALMEPTFCEMYANFCSHLASELPDFSEDNEKITFKREQEEANKVDEGEVRQSKEEREERRVKARRRMLGNIRLIGELYKKKMLTERIMHECIKKLLGQYEDPDEEDIEALCKLMSTIGDMIDHPKAKEHMDAYFERMKLLSNNMNLSSRVRFMLKDVIDLRKNKWQQRRKVEGPKKIEEVHRDAAQERQAQAGRMGRGLGNNQSTRRNPVDFGPRGSSMLSSPNSQMGGLRGLSTHVRGYGSQDARFEERQSYEARTLSVTLPQRPLGDDSITLGPQGGLARGMSIRGSTAISNLPVSDVHPGPGDSHRMTTGLNGYNNLSERTPYNSREDLASRYITDRFSGPAAYDQSSAPDRNINYGNRDLRNAPGLDRPVATSPPAQLQGSTVSQNASSEKVWTEERLRDMSMSAIKEYYSARDENEIALCIKDLNYPSFHPSMVSLWVTDSFERKDIERDLLAKLLVKLVKSQDGTLSQAQLIKGFEAVLSTLEDAVNDAPRAPEFLGRIFAKAITENVVTLNEIGQLIHDGGEEPGSLLEVGLAADVLGSTLEVIKTENGDVVLSEIRTSSNLRLETFRPPNPLTSNNHTARGGANGSHGAWCWYKVATQLKSEGHNVTTIELGGSGINPKQVQEIRSISKYYEPLMTFMDSVPPEEKVILVGHSLGGVSTSVAMEKFPEKISVAVFVTAYVLSENLTYPVLLQELARRTTSVMDTQFFFSDGPKKPATARLIGPKFMVSKMYQLSPPEDLTLALSLVRPVPIYSDVELLLKETTVTNERNGRVPKIFIISKRDNLVTEDTQRWMINRTGPFAELKVIKDSDHMVMFSKPMKLSSHLLKIAQKY
ncbi:Serine aminopeptidase, S33 [Sesbania bispinosa]|nr:Serine aminopeptidase, S33 [Sesbania bispinosa]